MHSEAAIRALAGPDAQRGAHGGTADTVTVTHSCGEATIEEVRCAALLQEAAPLDCLEMCQRVARSCMPVPAQMAAMKVVRAKTPQPEPQSQALSFAYMPPLPFNDN